MNLKKKVIKNNFKNISLNKLFTVIVIFQPNKKKIENVLQKHLEVFSNVIVVCNSSIDFKLKKKFKSFIFIMNKKNVGLAKALNIGIKFSIKKGAKYIALFDQDTLIKKNYFIQTKKSIKYLNLSKVAAIGPIFFNRLNNKFGKLIKFKTLSIQKINPKQKVKYYLPDYLITSGIIIPTSIFKIVGYMNEKLFIDLIDFEWCMRARNKGLMVVCFPKVKIIHEMGDSSFNFFSLRYNIYKPNRLYYFFRNSFYLYNSSYIKLNWKIIDFIKNLFRFIFYIVLIKPRIKNLKFIILGIKDAFKKKMGPLYKN